jgi:hypothetical protein
MKSSNIIGLLHLFSFCRNCEGGALNALASRIKIKGESKETINPIIKSMLYIYLQLLI